MEKLPLEKIASLKIELYGSLALTGKGHGTDRAVLMGLEGNEPSSIDTEQIPVRLDLINRNKTLNLMNEHCIPFEEKKPQSSIMKNFCLIIQTECVSQFLILSAMFFTNKNFIQLEEDLF